METTQVTTYLAPFVYNATVIAVHDADTLSARVDFGFHRYEEPVSIRILGIAARELTDPGGIEARDALRAILPTGTPIALYTAKSDKYGGRWLASVHYDNGANRGFITDLADVLIAQGWASPWNGKGTQPKPPWPREAP